MLGKFSQLLFAAIALPAVLRTARRVDRLRRRLRLDELADALRDVPPFRLGYLRRPRWLAGLVDRLLPWLPPRSYGPCLKRSLYLLDLWSRCGLDPELHLGMQRPEEDGEGDVEDVHLHAWVRARAEDGGELATPSSHAEIWRG